VNRGAVRRKLGDINGAISDYDQAIKLAPSDSDAYRNRGIAKEISGDIEGAQTDWRQAARLGDQEAKQWIALAKPQVDDLGILALTRMHSPDRAMPQSTDPAKTVYLPSGLNNKLQKLTLALMSKPSDPALLFKRGTELLKQGQADLAIVDFTKVLRTSPQSVKVIFNRAVARRQTGDLSGALEDYNQVVELAPKDREAYRNRGIVQQLLGSRSAACADWGIASALGDQEVRSWIRDECR
jgi:Flp pilus assembly protein TadD